MDKEARKHARKYAREREKVFREIRKKNGRLQSRPVLWKGGRNMNRLKMSEWEKTLFLVAVVLLLSVLLTEPAWAAPAAGQVSTAIESTWKTAAAQIKNVTNNVIFPVVDCVLAILLFVKLAMSYFEYRKHGEFEFTPVAILFFGLVFALTAPTYIWSILGI